MIDLSEQTRYITGARPFDPVRYIYFDKQSYIKNNTRL